MKNKTLPNKLSPEQFQITQQAATEPPFSSPLLQEKRCGIYACVCCGASLFHAKSKFDSGSGWPSFFQAIPDAVRQRLDLDLGMRRNEVLCAQCEAHLGHCFSDGPQPTGLRYCINGLALNFIPQ